MISLGVWCLLFAVVLVPRWTFSADNAQRPNILFIMADDNNGQTSETRESPSFHDEYAFIDAINLLGNRGDKDELTTLCYAPTKLGDCDAVLLVSV
jgi:hypothetical protein